MVKVQPANQTQSISDIVEVQSADTSQDQFGTQIQTQQVAVAWQFPVVFTQALFNPQNRTLYQTITAPEPQKKHRLLFFVDEGVAKAIPDLTEKIQHYCNHFSAQLSIICDPIVMPSGEIIKNDLHYVKRMQAIVLRLRMERHAYILGVGGGALLDAVGLVAATSHRGIRHIRLPTTVLSQNDSGVGVKNGVNMHGQKNTVGTFAPPFAVLNDYDFIETLPPREKIAGMAEAVKVGLIRDREFFEWLEHSADLLAAFDRTAMRYMIKRCAELHMRQISHGGDPFELGSARPLDFGHWAAHRLEVLTKHQVRHGEAVAIGIALDTRYSVIAELLKPGEDERVCRLLEKLGFNLWHNELLREDSEGRLVLIQGLQDFREHLGGDLTITLLNSLGTGVEVHQINDSRVAQSAHWLLERQHPNRMIRQVS